MAWHFIVSSSFSVHCDNLCSCIVLNCFNFFNCSYCSVGYSGGSRVEDGTYGYDAVNASHHHSPDAVLIATEGCSCPGVEVGNWLRAERLGHDIMFDLQNHAQGWIDWNLIVNFEGGPNHLGNLCDAAIVTNKDFSDVIVQPKFHYLAHFSKFIAPGAVRLGLSAVGNYDFAAMDPNIQAGVEVGMFACERSVRQTWSLVDPSTKSDPKTQDDYITDTPARQLLDASGSGQILQLSTAALTMDQSFNGTVKLCLAHSARLPRTALRLADCTDPDATFPLVAFNSLGQILESSSGLCVSFIGDVREPGALLELATCETVAQPSGSDASESEAILLRAADHQLFALSAATGEVTTPKVDRSLCLTAGWPFLTAVAFKAPSTEHGKAGSTSVVVMNEASATSPLVVSNKMGYLGLSIAARAIQTIVF